MLFFFARVLSCETPGQTGALRSERDRTQTSLVMGILKRVPGQTLSLSAHVRSGGAAPLSDSRR